MFPIMGNAGFVSWTVASAVAGLRVSGVRDWGFGFGGFGVLYQRKHQEASWRNV